MRRLNKQAARFWTYLITPARHIPAEEQGPTRLFNSILVLFVPIALFVISLRIWLTPEDIASTLFMVGVGLSVIGGIYSVNRQGYPQAAKLLTVTFGFGTIFLNAWVSDPPHIEILYLIFLPLFGTILFSLYATFLLSLGAVILLALFMVLRPSIPMGIAVDVWAFMVLTQTFILYVSHQRNKLEGQRRKLIKEQERAQVLNEMLSNMSHDLKTPLAVINSSLYLLGRVQERTKQVEVLARAQEQTARLERSIGAMLTMARLDYSTSFTLAQVDLNPLIEACLRQFQPSLERQGLEVCLELGAELPIIVGNRAALEQLVTNLIENAINYSASGGSLTLRTQTQGGQVLFEVQDTGIGIGENDLALIFERFYRADQARALSTGGTGLGLAIVKKTVELHGGQITVSSTLGTGSVFRVGLPLPEQQAGKLRAGNS